ncbi:hypothetical protein C4K06_4257 [Pseudomonas chlororaphis subsp. aureofaciens]|uniref:Uncharacterized protein n=1 Tax=Pseudomonas chlororaphis subsp. aureofaciens TaxID=587851 RepID=A0AAD1E7L1_9PSED|nr:hypothetical protein C4K08_4347 [Pseudomonas chlororaphis subsp. aureofaciens]AZE30966.1 hypothetical protein C4K07_4190 [Pseudomonas chlororaphis subsp. aureofaciens]AZE37281.1 hypothetical protein C4K06_4257 [Pseudomonas chlororaphis subsp. aureofaciens]
MSPNGRRWETHSQVGFAGRANRRSRSAAMRQASPTVAVSMRRTSGTGPEGHGREAAARCYGETTAQKSGRVILPGRRRLSKPADYCHSNKYPLWVSA